VVVNLEKKLDSWSCTLSSLVRLALTIENFCSVTN
jgi:hypothetical protein